MSKPGWITEDTNDYDYVPEGGDAPEPAGQHGTVVPVAPGASASVPAGAPEERLCKCGQRLRYGYEQAHIEECPACIVATYAPQPTPAALREWADWFDAPDTPLVSVETPLIGYHASYLLRRIADAMEGR